MSDNVKDFIIFCTNTEGEVVKLHIKNMLDSDERRKVAFYSKREAYLMYIVSALLIGMFCSIIVGCFVGLKYIEGVVKCTVFAMILLTFIKCCISKSTNKFYSQYFNIYRQQEWKRFSDTVEKTYSILSLLNAKTSEGTLLSENPQNQAAAISIVFCRTYFQMNWISYAGNGDQRQKDDRFNIERVIKNCKFEKDTVEYDIIKNELRVPLEYEEA